MQAVDDAIRQRIDGYPDEFWASAERDPRAEVHAYLQYPAMMVPEIQREVIKVVYEVQTGIKNVLDPFMGAATTMTSCMSFGLNFTGQDINPLAVLVSRAKMGPFDPHELEDSRGKILASIAEDGSGGVETCLTNVDKWFKPPVQIELSKIRRAIRAEGELWVRRFFWVALAETVRLTSNSRTSTYKLHIRPVQEIQSRRLSPIQVFQDVVLQNLEDLKLFRRALCKHLEGNVYKGQLAVHLQDTSKKVHKPPNATQCDLLITSPPYGDNLSTVTYGQFSYLPLQWIDLDDIDAKAADGDWLRTTQEIDRRSLGGKKLPDLESATAYLAERSSAYRMTIGELRNLPEDRPARVTTFLCDLEETLVPVVSIMRPNAYLIWIVGNRHVGGKEIPTDKILEELLRPLNVGLVKRVKRQILYRRMAARNRYAGMMRKEYVLVFRKRSE